MPALCRSCASSNPEGPAPTIATCVRMEGHSAACRGSRTSTASAFGFRLSRGACYWAVESRIKTRPQTINAAASRRMKSVDSPSTTTPTTNVPTAPIPVQTV